MVAIALDSYLFSRFPLLFLPWKKKDRSPGFLLIYIVLAIFLVTYGLLIFRRIGARTLPVWASMVIGAALMVATLSITPQQAFESIDFRVISFLFGMLVITAGFERSGLIEFFVLTILRRAKSLDRLLLAIIFGSGLLSAFLVNDTVALMVTPMVLGLAARVGLKRNRALLLPLAFGITTGSTFTPIGNPQNLLVTLNSGMDRPFTEFLFYLFVPSIISLFVVFLICKLLYRKDLSLAKQDLTETSKNLDPPSSAITDRALAKLSAYVLVALIAGFTVVEIFPSLQTIGFSINILAFVAGISLLVLSNKRSYYLITGLNWGILIFFAGMFVVMGAVWTSGIGSTILSVMPSPVVSNYVQSTASITTSSVVLSQILSNVPFVQLYSYQMHALGFTSTQVRGWLALAAGSTIAGNLTILGAVSNVIVIDSAETRKQESFSFTEFLKAGIPITIATALIFFLFLAFA